MFSISAVSRFRSQAARSVASGITMAGAIAVIACQDGTTEPHAPTAMSPSFAKGGAGPGGAKPLSRIVFASQRDEPGNMDLYSANSDGTGVTRLTNHVAYEDHPAVSNDGTRIAFVSTRYGGRSVFVMEIGGPGFWQLTAGNECNYPAWSPDDTRIAFSCLINGDFEIYSANYTGGGLVQLTNNAVHDVSPSYSPRTPYIVYSSWRDGGAYDVHTMRTDGTSVTRLTTAAAIDVDPTWSPDGKLIAFVSARGGTGLEIFTMKTDGTQVTRLTNNGFADEEPVWSPDSRRIAFQTYLGGLVSIWSMNIDGSGQAPMIDFSATYPAWGK